jgi:hypothetical protein
VTLGVGLAAPRAQSAYRYWRAKGLWRPFAREVVQVVSARHDFTSWESSGLVSIAHARAIEELRAFFKGLHLPELRVLYSDQVQDLRLDGPLILLGGPDSNAITRRAVGSLESSFRFGDPSRHEISFTDSRLGIVYVPQVDPDGALVTDYGLLVKCRNPFASDRPTNMMICAGSFGYGSWAAAKLAMSKRFLARSDVSRGAPFECLVKTFVIGETPQEPEIIELRELAD